MESLGLLVDSFNGGLRKDLTAAFENQPLYLKTFGDGVSGGSNVFKDGSGGASGDWVGGATTITAINSNASDIVFDGLRWDSIEPQPGAFDFTQIRDSPANALDPSQPTQ